MYYRTNCKLKHRAFTAIMKESAFYFMYPALGLDTNYFYIVINPFKNVKSIMKSNH